MAKKYTRKQIGSMRELDKEQERIRNKGRSIEQDFLEMINPQQLAITFLGNIVSRKIKGKYKKKADTQNKTRGAFAFNAANGKLKGVVKHPLFGKLLKKIGISFLKWQAFNLGLFIAKRIIKTIKEKKRDKSQKVVTMSVSTKK